MDGYTEAFTKPAVIVAAKNAPDFFVGRRRA